MTPFLNLHSAKVNEVQPEATGPLPALVVDGFDDEQIWQEIKLQNDAVLKYAQRTLDKLAARERAADQASAKKPVKAKRARASVDKSDGSGEESDELNLGESGSDEKLSGEESNEGVSEDTGSGVAAASSAEEAALEPPTKDLFFNLDEMAEFLEDAERKAEQGEEDNILDEDGGDDDADADDLRYEDFFDAPPGRVPRLNDARLAGEELEDGEDDDDEEEEEEEEDADEDGDELDGEDRGSQSGEEASLGAVDGEDDSGSEIVNDESDSAVSGDDGAPDASRFEQDAKKLAARISRLEEVNIGEKPWTLLGEATSRSRPTGSLLEEELDYDTASKQAPVITPEVTKSLEELIRGRIKSTMFDDPIRKTEADMPKFRPKVQLDEEKSKKGLGELYEEEYLRQTATAEKSDKTNPKHEEVSALFKKLCYKLDALSNFHYTPKPVRSFQYAMLSSQRTA